MITRMRVAKISKEELERRCADGSMYADFVPIGKWIDKADKIDAQFGRHDYVCPECGKPAHCFVYGSEDWWDGEKPNFCPNCGADMREGDANG